ncbi:MAG: hypothetical protein RRX92_04625 [Lachnospiraceae bacterium]
MNNKYKISDDEDYLSSASATDCTGLIPANLTTIDTLEVYKDIYPFGTPTVSPSKQDNRKES